MKDILDRASKAYYAGTPIMSDASFDILSAHFNYNAVGHQVTGGLPHFDQMYSLQKIFDIKEAPIDLAHCVKTPKLDGAAISLLYVEGVLTSGLTRGDGKIGQDISNKVSYLAPTFINQKGIVQITGEVLAPKSLPNPRNVASGALNLKDIKEFLSRPLVFVAYGISKSIGKYWDRDMENLEQQGFNTVINFDVSKYPTDGIVYRINNNTIYSNMGYTSKHPKGAFALKVIKEGVITTLLEVIWQVGKSGVVSPVAILKPINIDGATVSRATLHNIEYINDLNLEIGCRVEVIRAGEIIPRVVKRVN